MTKQELRKYRRESYEWYKSHGICPVCRVNESAPGRVKCLDCLERDAERSRKYRDNLDAKTIEEKKKSHRKYVKDIREQRKSRGLCIYCGKPQSRYSSTMCVEHMIANRNRQRKRRENSKIAERSELPLIGLCYRCKSPTIPSKKLCPRCYEQSLKNLKTGKAIGHYNRWRRDNELTFGGAT